MKRAVEPGHSWWHGGDLRLRADHARDNACAEVGWHVMRSDESMRADLAAAGHQIANTYLQRLAARAERSWTGLADHRP